MEPNPRTARVHEAIERGLGATHIEVIDHSAEHAGHPGAANGGGHFQVIVVSERFDGLSRVAAQRLVYEALGELMTADIHALSMLTMTPEEWHARSDQGSQ